jgi:hypothetical protein
MRFINSLHICWKLKLELECYAKSDKFETDGANEQAIFKRLHDLLDRKNFNVLGGIN